MFDTLSARNWQLAAVEIWVWFSWTCRKIGRIFKKENEGSPTWFKTFAMASQRPLPDAEVFANLFFFLRYIIWLSSQESSLQ